jgi:hypothetical protein
MSMGKIVEMPVWYRDTADMREAGHGDYAALIEAMGLPLELIHLGRDRVLHIREFDYAEGHEKPLEQRDTWWLDALDRPLSALRCTGIIAVHPDGSRHMWISR